MTVLDTIYDRLSTLADNYDLEYSKANDLVEKYGHGVRRDTFRFAAGVVDDARNSS